MTTLKKTDYARESESKPTQSLDVDITYPVDINKGTEQLGGSDMMFYMMLEKLEEMSLTKCMEDLAVDVNKLDFLEMKNHAHSLKGASA